MVHDAALRGAFMSHFVSFGEVALVCVRPDCHQKGHQNHVRRTGCGRTALEPILM